MRYTPAPMFLDFTGRSGGYVFSKNKGGKYLKGFVPPSNPDTASQVEAREIFSQVAPLWTGLSTSVRGDFDAFANSGYQPLRRPNNETAYTGRQAYSALAIAAKNSIAFLAKFVSPDSYVYTPSAQSSAKVITDFAVPTAAPGLYLQSNLISIGAWSSGFSDFSIVETSVTNKVLALSVTTPLPAATYTTQNFRIGGSAAGLALYVSNEVPADGIKTQNDFETKLLMTKVIDKCTITIGASQSTVGIGISVTSPNLPTTTGWRKATLIAQTAFGGQRVLMSKYINFG